MNERNAVTTEGDTQIRPICVEPIQDETANSAKQDALFCEGDCQCWHHRWCSSVSKERYAALSDSTEPFLCPSCTAANQQAAILGLRDCLNAFTDEVRVMKTMVDALQKQYEKTETLELQATAAALQRSVDRGSGTKVVPKPRRAWNVVATKGILKKNGAGNGTRKGDEGQKRDVSRQALSL